ncbi:MAG: hypothetical protein J6U05_06650 [Neisseriaceae bacterium]|nr:hypothetical protein [Neisseriaceae bacterium]
MRVKKPSVLIDGFLFQAALIVIASLAKARRGNLLKLFLTSISEVKNNFRVA